MESINNKIGVLYPQMGPAERKIADYVLTSPTEAVKLSISELAQICGCGDATIVRFSRRLGLAGYQEFRIRLASDLSTTSKISSGIQKGDSCYTIFQKRIGDITSSLYNTESVLNGEHLEQAANAIMKADRIVVFGLGNSAAIAQDAAHKFLRLGLSAQCSCDNHMQAIIASHLKKGSVAIGISHSGRSIDIIEALKLCKLWGAMTIAITNYDDSPITAVSDLTLFTKSEETKNSVLAMSSRIAQLAIFDSIYTYIVLNMDEFAEQATYNTEAALRQKKVSK